MNDWKPLNNGRVDNDPVPFGTPKKVQKKDEPDVLILLERKHPTIYEIHRGEIRQTKNLILTTDDKEFAERLVGGYNSK